MMLTAVDSDAIWPWIYKLLGRFLSDDPIIVAAECPEPVEAAEVGLDPLTIIAIIRAIAELIKLFRNR